MAMLELYAQAWVVDGKMADLIRDAWFRGEIDEDQALHAWSGVTRHAPTATDGDLLRDFVSQFEPPTTG